jgi:plastocyanin
MLKKLLAFLGLSSLLMLSLAACGTTASGPNTVHMSSSQFAQSSITIKKGESITLANDDLFVPHIIANGTWTNNSTAQPAKETGAPEIKDIKINSNSSTTIGPFANAGTFQLYCTIHPGMNLTVIVQ